MAFCERLTSWYRRAGSSPDLGPRLWQGMRKEGFRVHRDLVVIYGNNTVGDQPFARCTAMTARNLCAVFQDIVPEPYCETLYGALLNDFADGLLGCMATNLVVGEKC